MLSPKLTAIMHTVPPKFTAKRLTPKCSADNNAYTAAAIKYSDTVLRVKHSFKLYSAIGNTL